MFYRKTLSKWIPDRQSSVLVVAGGPNDRDVFHALGFSRVTLSNLEPPSDQGAFHPYPWSRQNVEALGFGADEYDYVVVHAGLHHCHSPHRGLLEMYRVARKALIMVEPPDNLTVRIMMRLGLAQTYENTVVCDNKGAGGGVNNSTIPNYVYRFTEREIEKTIQSFAPIARHRLTFAYGYDQPGSEFIGGKDIKYAVVRTLMPFYTFFVRCFPKQGNLFAARIEKPQVPSDLLPWLQLKAGIVQAKGS